MANKDQTTRNLNLNTLNTISFILISVGNITEASWLFIPGLLSALSALIMGIFYISILLSGDEPFSWWLAFSTVAATFFSIYAYDLLTGQIF